MPVAVDLGTAVAPGEIAQLEQPVLEVSAHLQVFNRRKVRSRLDHPRADLEVSCVGGGLQRARDPGEQYERTFARCDGRLR